MLDVAECMNNIANMFVCMRALGIRNVHNFRILQKFNITMYISSDLELMD